MLDHDDIERAREMNEGVHPRGPDQWDEVGRFAIRVVFQSECEERIESRHTSLRIALTRADERRAELSAPWRASGRNPRAHVHVDVIDEDDPERGSLDWDVLP